MDMQTKQTVIKMRDEADRLAKSSAVPHYLIVMNAKPEELLLMSGPNVAQLERDTFKVVYTTQKFTDA